VSVRLRTAHEQHNLSNLYFLLWSHLHTNWFLLPLCLWSC